MEILDKLDLDKLDSAEFLDSGESGRCDGGLPPGCDCVCHQSCDFGKTGKGYSAGSSEHESNPEDHKVYEMI